MTGQVTVGFLHPGSYAACFAESLSDLFLHDLTGEQRMVSHAHGKMGKECGANGIVSGRNTLARAMVEESAAEWLFMVDSDMGFAPDTVERLVASADPVERPVVGALCFAMKSDGKGPMFARRYRMTPTIYDFHETDTQVGFVARMNYQRDALQECAGTGAACTLIHRSVLRAVHAKYGPEWYDPITHPKGPTVFGEDLSFCVRVAACGFPLWVDSSVKTTHDKGFVFLDEETFDAQQSGAVRPYTRERRVAV